ncbi:MAG: hypothetical protein EAZ23_02715 [Oscillatoriales cyanobacterium]|nr:MAG: hypothetical protein EAZ23_02715 [Oscillatoriales cyanobacterium]
MKFRAISLLFATWAIAILSLVFTPPAWATTQIKLSDLSYHECPAEMAEGTVTSGSSMEANCFLITGKAENTIYDADENPVMQNRTRLGSIEEVPPGISDFQLRISVAANQRTPLQLKQFKATGFTGVVRR